MMKIKVLFYLNSKLNTIASKGKRLKCSLSYKERLAHPRKVLKTNTKLSPQGNHRDQRKNRKKLLFPWGMDSMLCNVTQPGTTWIIFPEEEVMHSPTSINPRKKQRLRLP